MKLAPRPKPITNGGFRAIPMGSPVTHWEIRSLNRAGSPVISTMTAEQFALDGDRALEAFASGQPFLPRVTVKGLELTPEEIQERQIAALERGADATTMVNDWTRYVAAEECREEGALLGALQEYSKAQWPAFVREVFSGLYGSEFEAQTIEPEDRQLGSEWIEEVLTQAEALEDWQELKEKANGDPWSAGLCASLAITRLVSALDDKLNELPDEDPQELQDTAETIKQLAGEESDAFKEAQEKADAALEQAQKVATQLGGFQVREMLAVAIVGAIEEAKAEISAVENAMACVPGFQPGTAELDSKQVGAPREEIRELLQRDRRIANMLHLAGRLRLEAKKKQRSKTRYVAEQTVGVTVGDEINRILPAEAMLLACEETEAWAFRRLLEKQMLQYDVQGTETETRGPVIMCVDGSGSMSGLRNEWAMAAALAMAQICSAQRRAFQLVHFSYNVDKVFTIPRGARITFDEMVAMVSYFNGGGTDFCPPLDHAAAELSKKDWKKSDVVLVTDGAGRWYDSVKKLHAIGASVFGLAIGASFSDDQKTELDDSVEVRDLNDRKSEQAAANVLFTV